MPPGPVTARGPEWPTEGALSPTAEFAKKARDTISVRVRSLGRWIAIIAFLLTISNAGLELWVSAAATFSLALTGAIVFVVAPRGDGRYAVPVAHLLAAMSMLAVYVSSIAEIPSSSNSFFYCSLTVLCAAHMVDARAARLWAVIGVLVIVLGHATDIVFHLSPLSPGQVMLHVLDSAVLVVFAAGLAVAARTMADRQIAEVLERERTIRKQADELSRAKLAADDATAKALEAARTLERTNADLERANRAKSLFLANMSHEIRTPMNGVLGMVEILATTPLDAEQKGCLEAIRTSGRTLLTVINDVLDFSKMEAGKMSLRVAELEVRPTIESAVRMFAEPARGKGVELALQVEEGVPTRVMGDEVRIRQIVSNVVSNAVKFTDRGAIRVHVSRAPAADASGVRLVIECSDTGVGISSDVQARLFRAFEQGDGSTTRRSGGTGLGLAICRQLVELMSGSITVKSSPGVGSVFHIEVVLAAVRAEGRASSRPRSGASTPLPKLTDAPLGPDDETDDLRQTLAGMRVLLVEDNVVNRMIALKFLARLGALAETAENGEEALERVRASGPYDVILMDCQMPVMDGYSATEALRKMEAALDRHTPVIALTANALEGDAERCLAAGMDAHLGKPYGLAQLADALVRVRAASEATS